jgi:hypothetical protein
MIALRVFQVQGSKFKVTETSASLRQFQSFQWFQSFQKAGNIAVVFCVRAERELGPKRPAGFDITTLIILDEQRQRRIEKFSVISVRFPGRLRRACTI